MRKKLDFAAVLANAVHDMKNSVAMLLGTLDQLGAECDPAGPVGARLGQMQQHGRRLNADLVQLLTIYKIEQDAYAPDIREVDVGEFLQDCADLFQPLLQARAIIMTTRSDPGLRGYFDREMVAGIINNAVNNASRYARHQILLSASADNDGGVVMSVADDGPGFPDEVIDAGAVVPGTTDFRSGSTSLGLYFAALIAGLHENHGRRGRISCTNGDPAGGAVFSLYLP